MKYILLFFVPLLAIAENKLEVPPYSIPTFSGKEFDFKAPVPALEPAIKVDTDGLFRAVVNCFPERLEWGFELKAQAGLRETFGNNNSITTLDTSGLAKHYIGIVAEMPLFSASEINTERRTEVDRRLKVAETIKDMLAALSKKRRAIRQLGIYEPMEIRSRIRVNKGIAPSTEQTGFLDRVATEQSNYDEAVAAIDGARLALVGQCRDEVAESVNQYIVELVQ